MSGMAAIGRLGGRGAAIGAVAVMLLGPVTARASVVPALPTPAGFRAHAILPAPITRPAPAGGQSRTVVLNPATGPTVVAILGPPPPAPPVPPQRPAANVVADVPELWQIYALSCESAALQMALIHEGISASQDRILDVIGADLRGAYWDSHGMRWGDPYSTFVGYVGGSEDFLTGYGTYFPPIARAAEVLNGRVLLAGEGISPSLVYDAIAENHPVVLWISYDYSYHPRQDYVTFDGRQVLYAGPFEHAVTGIGVDEGSILINDPLSGQFWVDKPTFESTYDTYNQMAVVLD